MRGSASVATLSRRFGPARSLDSSLSNGTPAIDAAYLGFDETRKGSIEIGKLGDLAVLTDDLLTCPVERIKDIKAVVTVMGGRVVHEDKP